MSESAPSSAFPAAGESQTGSLPDGLSAPQWLAAYTSPRHEKRVDQYLGLKQIEHYLPLYHPRRKWADGSTVTLDLPLFPGYIFVRIDRTDRVRVLQVPGIVTFVGGAGGHPALLPESEIEALRAGLHLRRAEPHPLLTVGQRARIRSGALAGMEGVVARQKGGLRIVLTVNLILQSVAVEVDESEVEPIASGVPACTKGFATWPNHRNAQASYSGSRGLAWSLSR